MRPLRLRLQGLRSYREEQEVDFTDASLVAIVGDTGAGKSSLLEAITVALYGTSTWDGKEIKPLISDGGTTMQVSLVFRADGKEWRVERAISRGNYPPPRHTLELLSGGERHDKKDAVDARIKQLVGLDYDAFLRSVVLPQGRFAALLQAKQAERASILKGILRIDRLDVVRERAREARDRMVPIVDSLREKRSKLLPDPAASELDAEQRIRTAEKQRAAIEAAQKKVISEKERGRAAAERRRSIESLLGRAREGAVSGAAEIFRGLAEKDAEIQAALARNDADLAMKRGEEDELSLTIEEAEKKGAGPVSLGHAKTGLSMLASELPILTEEAATIEKEEAALAKDAADLEKAETQLAGFAAAETEAKKAHQDLKAESKRAAEALESGRRLLKELRSAEGEEAKAAKKAEKARADLEKARADLTGAQSDAKKAEDKLAEAESAARAAAQKHAAHHAAEGTKAGDPCPVCERPLPDGFKAPRAPALETAQKKLEKAKADDAKAREKLAGARSKVDAASEKSAELDADLSERATRTREVTQALTAALPAEPALKNTESAQQLTLGLPAASPSPATSPTVTSPAGALQADDSAILAAAAARSEAAAQAQAEAETRFQKTRDDLTRAKAEFDAAKKRLKERKDSLKKSKEALTARRKRLDETIARMPADLRPKPPYQTADIGALTARVELRRLKIEKVVTELEDTRAARRVLEQEKSHLTERRQRDVASKAGDLDVRLATTAERLSLLAEALPAEGPAPRPETANLAERADWATDFERTADSLLTAADAALTTARVEALSAEEQAKSALAAAGVDNEGALGAALSRAEGHLASATADLQRARADRPIAEALDARIDRTNGLVTALNEVTRLVADGKLIHHVVHRRQRVLLAVASELLGSMTKQRFGFSEDFDVVDRVSGQARSTRTLSGGETFLASLALSLALVELAGRAGGRLEALFLDEGFGSLDASSLGEALVALTQKAEGGRLVAVISHLKSVAESIDRVLAVKQSPTGSKVAWMSTEERERMLNEDVERGLIS
jgi:DNA repair protein SbcC/Rad50